MRVYICERQQPGKEGHRTYYEQAVSYLKGEMLAYPGEYGWNFATFDNYSTGWGKRSVGKAKNYYPKG